MVKSTGEAMPVPVNLGVRQSSPILLMTPRHCGNRGCWKQYANQISILQPIQTHRKTKRSRIIPYQWV